MTLSDKLEKTASMLEALATKLSADDTQLTKEAAVKVAELEAQVARLESEKRERLSKVAADDFGTLKNDVVHTKGRAETDFAAALLR